MKLTNTAIKYRTTMLVLTVLLVVGGLISYVTIPKESNPSIEFPMIVVTAIYPGASPSDVEATITQILEQEISTVNGIDEMESTSSVGVSTIVIEFTPDVSTDKAYQEVNNAVDRAQPELPASVEDPFVSEISFEDFPVMTVNLAADYSLARLKEVAENLKDEVGSVPNVLEANLVGGLTREVQINVDLSALKAYDVTFGDIIGAIQTENVNIPGGNIDVDRRNYLVRVSGEFDNPAEQIKHLVIKTTDDGQNVYVRDVANVVFGFKERQTFARLQVLKRENDAGELVLVSGPEDDMLPVISLGVSKASGANILTTIDEVKLGIEEFDFPTGTQVTITGDQSVWVEQMVSDLENNIISGLIFVIAILLFFLGVRNATLVGIAIPLSMFLSFIAFQMLGQTLNFIILFSFIIALGMLVDNAIVIVENIYRFYENGYSRFEAARLGTAEVAGPVIASTATTVLAFSPMLFWPGIIGEFMGYMPLTLIITLTASLVVALLLNPVITGTFIKMEDEEGGSSWRDWPKAARYLGAGVILLLALVLGIANWQTLVVILVGAPSLYLLYTRLLHPVVQRFMKEGLPRIVAKYRKFLQRMLERDYTPKRALARNTAALGALAAGFILLVLGGAVTAAAGMTAAMVLLVPGGILFGLGALGMLVHTFESVYLGGRASVKYGSMLLGVIAVILLVSVLNGAISVSQFVALLVAPVIIVLVGLAGMLFNRRRHLILTDNRARLLTGSIGGLFIIIFMFMAAPTGQGFFPNTDPQQVQIALSTPLGTTPEATNAVAQEATDRIHRFLEENPASRANVKNILVNVGAGDGFGGGRGSEEATITLMMVDWEDREEPTPLTLSKLRANLQGIPGVELDFTQSTMGPPTGPPINIEISGPEFEQIVEIANTLDRTLSAAARSGEIAGLVDVADNLNRGRPEVLVDVNRERAAQFGLSSVEIAQTVRTAIQGAEADKYRSGDDEYDITVRLQESDRQSLASLQNLVVTNNDGVAIPLVTIANLEEGVGFGSVTRIDEQRVVTVSGDAAPGYNGPEVLMDVQAYLGDYRENLAPGYTMEYTGGNEEQEESFGFLTIALLIGVMLIFLVMIAQFNSVAAPFIIIVAVGLSMVGVYLGLILTRTPFNLFTFIGVIGLAGIVVNNNIVLIDYIMQLRVRGFEKLEAVIEGGATRLRPVILTAATTVLGLMPLTLGINIDFMGLLTDLDPNFGFGSANTQFWGPMGITIISGLLFATFLTLVIVPALYSAFDSISMRLAEAMGKDPGEAGIVSDTVATNDAMAASPGGSNGASRDKEDVRFGRHA